VLVDAKYRAPYECPMHVRSIVRLCSAFSLALVCSAATLLRAAEIAPRSFAHPERIRYDSHCLTIDGHDVFIYSGAFHYFRCPKPLWRDRFQKIRDAGFNTVETYIAWNWHEREMPAGVNDFSKVDLKEFEEWLNLAEEFGLYVIARPGPYICAEWDTGGFPQWLLTKQPPGPLPHETWLRSDEPAFLAWSKHWFDAVCPVIARHQITRKPPGQPGVILCQIENEYDFAHFPDDVKSHHLAALAVAARANGIDVPLFTCWTKQIRGSIDPRLRDVFDSCNFYPRWNVDGEVNAGLPKLRVEQPDAPLMTTELQGGWFSQVGGKLSENQEGITAEQINNLTLLTIQRGETLLNYYMLFGGTNLGDWGARRMTTSYDYNAPIREWGGGGDRYQRVWALGHFLREHGAELARAEEILCDVTTEQSDVTVVLRRARDGSRYFFVRTSQHLEPRRGVAHIKERGANNEIAFSYDLEPFGSKVLHLRNGVTDPAAGEWLPKAAPAVERPTELPAAVTITTARRRDDPGPSQWRTIAPVTGLANIGIYDSRFIVYRADLNGSGAANLFVDYPSGDDVSAFRGGKKLARTGGTKSATSFAVPDHAGPVLLLYENFGHANGGRTMEQVSGLSSARLSTRPAEPTRPIGGWRSHEVDGTSRRPEIKTDFNDAAWPTVAVDKLEANNLPAGRTVVFRATVDVSADELKAGKIDLTFGRIDDLGWIYVNGQKIGETTDWSRPHAFEVTRQLHAGANVVAVIVQNETGDGGLGAPMLSREPEGTNLPLTQIGELAGIEQQWWNPSLDEAKWTTTSIGSDSQPAEHDALLTWYRLAFALPVQNPRVWVPWRLHLEAAGNGFIYLNGHPLGRYWQAGPQHDFFLPECWLNFGSGQTNVLTLNLRALDAGNEIKAAVVEPYREFAEKR
jgi:hypothetical protein